jgi:hypothetical protein
MSMIQKKWCLVDISLPPGEIGYRLDYMVSDDA